MSTQSRLGLGTTRLLAFYRKRPVVQMYVTFGLTLFLITFFTVFAIRPTAITIINLIHELETKKQLAVTLDSKIAAIFAAQSTYADVVEKLQALDNSLPQTPSLGGFVEQIQLLSASRQIKIRAMSFEQFNLLGGAVPGSTNAAKKTSPGSLTSYPFTLSVVGPYSNLEGFLSDIEDLRRIVVLKGFSLVQTQNDTSGPTITLTISGEVYALGKGAS